MAAAGTLAERGFQVTLLERAGDVGGKLAGWPIEVLGETVPMEHGFHGFFRQYYNLLELLRKAGADADLVEQPSYTVLFANGRQEPFGTSVAPFPLDLLEVLGRSPSLSLADVAGDRPGMRALLAYDPEETFARWDSLSAVEFIERGALEGGFTDLILEPFGQASMNALEGFSAAELIRFFHFYMLGNPEGLGFSALGRGTHLTVLKPLVAWLTGLGVEIRTSTPVERVLFEGGRAIGVQLGTGGKAVELETSAVPEQGWAAAEGVFVRRTADGFEARDARCTHMGCPVQHVRTGFFCPCHAGRYDDDGVPVAGPPPRPLQDLPVDVDGERLSIGVPGRGEQLLADHVVLATEVRGLQALSAASDFEAHAPGLAASAAAVGEAEPYAVVRFWLDKPVDPTRTAFYTTAGFTWTDSIATYSAFQQPFIDWASRTGGSVVECHAYAIPRERQGTLQTYRDGLLTELRQAFPELADAVVLHEEAMTQSNFTRFAPGDFAQRTGVVTEVENLFCAGDHVKLPFPAFLMEAAASSGVLAANAICAAEGVAEEPVRTVALSGRLAGVLGDG